MISRATGQTGIEEPDAGGGLGPLYVELEGGLITADFRWNARVLGWVRRRSGAGATSDKSSPMTGVQILCADAHLLPYRAEVVEFLQGQKRAGRRIVLVSGRWQEIAEAVEGHLKLFDSLHMAPLPPSDLSFDYLGPRGADFAWRTAARRIYQVGGSASTGKEERPSTTFPAPPRLPGLIVALRPHQWLKNLLLLLPLILAHKLNDVDRRWSAVLAFWSLSFCASAVYILNDLLDLSSDRRHETKRHRPFASGRVSIPSGLVLAGVTLALGLALSLALPGQFRLMLVGYLAMTTAYSVWLKQKMLIDVMVLAALYTWRIIAGAVAVDVPLSIWLLAFSMFFFLSLAFVKRYSELIKTEHAGGDELKGRGYRVSDLRIIEVVGPTSGYLSVLVFCNYLDSAAVRTLYDHPRVLWLVAPLLLYWITRIWFVARRRLLDDDPVIYAVRDRVSQLTGILTAGVVLIAWLPRPHWWPF